MFEFYVWILLWKILVYNDEKIINLLKYKNEIFNIIEWFSLGLKNFFRSTDKLWLNPCNVKKYKKLCGMWLVWLEGELPMKVGSYPENDYDD